MIKRYYTQCGNPYSCDYAEAEDANGRFILVDDLPVEALEAAVVELSARRQDAELLAGSADINHAARLRIIERTTRHIDQLRDLLLAIRGG